eukprot:6213781-Pleurochrysis_carterae.AAC.1
MPACRSVYACVCRVCACVSACASTDESVCVCVCVRVCVCVCVVCVCVRACVFVCERAGVRVCCDCSAGSVEIAACLLSLLALIPALSRAPYSMLQISVALALFRRALPPRTTYRLTLCCLLCTSAVYRRRCVCARRQSAYARFACMPLCARTDARMRAAACACTHTCGARGACGACGCMASWVSARMCARARGACSRCVANASLSMSASLMVSAKLYTTTDESSAAMAKILSSYAPGRPVDSNPSVSM